MRKLGEVIHRNRNQLVIRCPAGSGVGPELIGAEIFSREGIKLGKLMELFGPVSSPYGVVKLGARIPAKINQVYLR